MSNEFDEELRAIRESAERLGMLDPPDGPTIESADAFISRMKRDNVPGPLARHRSPWVRRAAVGVAAAAAALVVAVLMPASQETATAGTPPVLDFEFADGGDVATAHGRPASRSLRDLAAVARDANPGPTTGTAQEVTISAWFAQLDDQAATESAPIVPTLQVSRLAADGSLVVESQRGRALSIDGRGVKSVTGDPETREEIPAGTFDANRARDMGAEPAAVRQALLSYASCESRTSTARTRCLVTGIDNMAHQWVIPPDLAAAFWEVLADEAGLRSLGAVEDRAGRAGVGIAIDFPEAPAKRMILIISSTDGRLLGSETVLVEDDIESGVKAPAVYSFTAILKSDWAM